MTTEAQAHANLEAAIEDYLRDVGTPGLLLDWVLVAHKVEAGDDGEDHSSTTYVGAQRQTSYRTLGLLDFARTVVQTEIAQVVPEGDDG